MAGERPPSCPRTCRRCIYARKVLRRVDPAGDARGLGGEAEKPPDSGSEKPGGPKSDPATRAEAEQLVGTLLLEAVAASRSLGVDPELALRQTARKLEGSID